MLSQNYWSPSLVSVIKHIYGMRILFSFARFLLNCTFCEKRL